MVGGGAGCGEGGRKAGRGRECMGRVGRNAVRGPTGHDVCICCIGFLGIGRKYCAA